MMICSRRLYKGNAYDICLPLADSGVTLARFYTSGDVIVEKEPEISGDSMCFSFTEEDLASLEDGVLRYQVVTDYETTDTNSPYVVVTPGDYSGSTLEDLLEDAYNSGYTAGYESGYTDGQEECRDYSREYFTIEALEDGNLIVRKWCDYSINGGEWVSISGETSIPLNGGDKVRFKKNDAFNDIMFSSNTIRFIVYGNIMSLRYGADFEENTTCFVCRRLFYDATGLVDASNLVLRATNLIDSCYFAMFQGCTSLTKAPELPATTLALYCYNHMFYDCASLVSTPALPATILVEACYAFMFVNCTSLTTAPELPSIDLADYCYEAMFSGCASLVQAPELPATVLTESCYSSMFGNCTSLVRAPELPATTLATECYVMMFMGCTSLEYIKCLATDLSASICLQNWARNVSTTGTFVKAQGVEWPTGVSGIPTGWTVVESQ